MAAATSRHEWLAKNVYKAEGVTWMTARRKYREPSVIPIDTNPSSRRAAAATAASVVEVLLLACGRSGLSMRRWCLLRATCTAARDAMPLLMRLSDLVRAYGSRQLVPFYTSVEPVVRADDLLLLLGHSQTGAAGTGVSLAEEVGDATARAAGGFTRCFEATG